MFNIIEPQEHHLYESTINVFLQELHSAVGFEQDQNLTNATYILLEEELKGLQGGVLLLKQPLEAISKEVRTYLETICPQYNPSSEIWTGRIAFKMGEDISGRDYERVSKLLYRTLYEDLIAFGVKENTPFLCLTLPLVEHLSIDMLGLWPYLMKIRPCESPDGLFHGILSLAGEMHSSSDFWSSELNGDSLALQNCDKIITS